MNRELLELIISNAVTFLILAVSIFLYIQATIEQIIGRCDIVSHCPSLVVSLKYLKKAEYFSEKVLKF